jgi:hypothetical protein
VTLLDVRRAVLGRDATAPTTGDGIAGIVKETEDQAGERLAAVSFRSLCDAERRGRTPGGAVERGAEPTVAAAARRA